MAIAKSSQASILLLSIKLSAKNEKSPTVSSPNIIRIPVGRPAMVARMLSVSVVMFAYNEEENIAFCMEEALDFLASATKDYELILVDDGSSDGTAEAGRSVQAKRPEHVQVVSYHPNRGIGGALKAGYAVATKEYITCLPADGQVPPSGLQNLFDVLASDDKVDLVTCHFPHRFEEADPFFRKVLSRGLRLVLWLATGVGRKMDGVYLIPREVVQKTVLKSDTFFLNLELPIRAIRSGLRPGEATMHIRPRRAGASKVLGLGRIWMVFRETVRLGLELRFGVGKSVSGGQS